MAYSISNMAPTQFQESVYAPITSAGIFEQWGARNRVVVQASQPMKPGGPVYTTTLFLLGRFLA